jgi:LigXa C-terminal domain like
MARVIGLPTKLKRSEHSPTAGPWPGILADSSDWLGTWRLEANAANDYQIDREIQRSVNFTGINGIHLQDQAITESMGPTYERTREHLGTSDRMVILTRRRVINAARALAEKGEVPACVDEPSLYMVRSGGVVLPRNADWLEATADLRRALADDVFEEQARVGVT